MKPGLTIICAFLMGYCFAQSSIQIKAFEDHLPLPYASVVNITKHELHFTDEKGNVAANFDINDSLSISYVGFQNLKARIEGTGSQVYFLKQSNTVLEPVQIENCRNWAKQEYTNLISDMAKREFGGVGWTKNAMNSKVAVMLKPGIEDARLNSFSFWLNKGIAPKVAIQAPMIFTFYSIDESSMLPGELISNQQVIYHPEKEGQQTILIDTLHLQIPRPGIYVSIDYVFNDKFQYPMRYKDEKKGIDSIYIKYGGIIEGVYSKDTPIAFYNYEKNSWSFPLNRDKSWLLEMHGTIKFSAEVSLCIEEKK